MDVSVASSFLPAWWTMDAWDWDWDWDWSLVTHPEASASEEVALERAAGRARVMCTSSGKWLGRYGLAPPGCCR